MLSGRAAGDLKTVSLTLGAHILRNAGAVDSVEAGIALLEEKIKNGEGLKKLSEMIAAQGGNPQVAYDTSLLPKAKYHIDVTADRDGYIAAMHTGDIGNAAKLLGAGRERKTDVLDLSVGLVMKVRVGDKVKKGDVLCTLHAGDKSDRIGAHNLVRKSIIIGDEKPEALPLIRAVVE